ncbi:MAG: PSD1 and planctomycete cytochrome C domain-containing protein [Planctomycetaceae bacterium]|nr:PSD1 and planctomycete cytochrome C domain-containing protein [Planctomycetaceae bacterium]
MPRPPGLIWILPLFAVLWLPVGDPLPAAAGNRPGLPPPLKRKVDFDRDIQPLLVRHCLSCHGPKRQESDYRLDRSRIAISGGDRQQRPIRPGRSAQSPLIHYVAGTDPDTRMPPKGPGLTRAQVALLRAWIDQGARFSKSASTDPPLRSSHWSFQPLATAVPPPSTAGRNPIDAFLQRRLAAAGLTFSPRADRRTLVRRLYLDLLGLPPSPETIDSFLRDKRPEAWSQLVDRVLAHPHYGERWARHWLDVVRFAESHGFETNRERPTAWYYRDWCIEALNTDLPYDRFIVSQLAGDATGDPAATGFLVAGPSDLVKSPDITLTLAQRQDELADMINTTGTAILGLTLGCARCHNHKFDPVTQTDYYAMAAVFSGVSHGERPLPLPVSALQRATVARQLGEDRSRLASLISKLRQPVNARHNVERFAAVTAKFVRFTIRNTNGSEPCLDELEIYTVATPDRPARNVALASRGTRTSSSGNFPAHPFHKLAHINDGRHGNRFSWIANQVGRGWVQLEFPTAVRIDRIEWGRDRTGKYTDRLPTRYWIEVAERPGQWREIAGIHDRAPFGARSTAPANRLVRDDLRREAALARGLQGQVEKATRQLAQVTSGPVAYVGRFEQPGPTHRLYRGDPLAPRELVGPGAVAALAPPPMATNEPEQQRRLKLGRWLVRPDNPLAPRVIANRLWHYHFGTGLVSTPSDLGGNGTRPSHPLLLDWMAGHLVETGWSLKSLHRLILTSRAWCQSSRPRADGLAVDSEARLLWRFPPRRLAAEAIRDGMLVASGSLNRQMGGPGFKVFEVVMENVRHYFPKKSFAANEWRRMVYMTKIRQEQDEVFGPFDCPDGNQVVARRSRSTTPLQALGLLNGHFVLQQSSLLARRIQSETPTASTQWQISRAFRLVLGRHPSADELAAALPLTTRHGLPALARALLNSNEFLWLP